MSKIKAKRSILDIMDEENGKGTKKTKKQKKLKEKKIKTEEENELQRFIIICVVILVVLLALYFVTKIVVNKREKENEETKTEVNYDIVSVGTMFNRPPDDYYVLIYDSSKPTADYYKAIFDDYKNIYEKRIYFCDLNKAFNKKYASGERYGNSEAKTREELSFGEITLLEIKDHEIFNYYEDIGTINELLSVS